MMGEVVSVSKTGYHVHFDGQTQFCLVNNSFKADTSPIVGDIVQVEKREDKYFVLDIHPRKSVICRYDEIKQKRQYIAANVDVVFVVTSANREFSPNRIKRFLALCENQPVRCVVVMTKIDLKSKMREFDDLGAEIVRINALNNNDVRKLLDYVDAGQTALLLGSSGVGKSTIINSLCGLNLKTREVQGDRRMNQGRHTTSARTMYYLDDGRKIIDCPGVRAVGNPYETFD